MIFYISYIQVFVNLFLKKLVFYIIINSIVQIENLKLANIVLCNAIIYRKNKLIHIVVFSCCHDIGDKFSQFRKNPLQITKKSQNICIR